MKRFAHYIIFIISFFFFEANIQAGGIGGCPVVCVGSSGSSYTYTAYGFTNPTSYYWYIIQDGNYISYGSAANSLLPQITTDGTKSSITVFSHRQ
jgi:hypothetical protein